MPTALTFANVALATLRIAVPTILESVRGTLDVGVCNERLTWWARSLLRDVDMTLIVEGRENIAEGETYVVMSNHQSHYDIPVVFEAFGKPIRMVAKKELYRIPIFAQAMRIAEFVEVDRGNRARAVASLDRAKQTLAKGISIWIAPEGTRSDSGRLGKFKTGGFHLAMETGARILPITIDGTRHVLPARGKRVTKGLTARCVIGAPIDPGGRSDRPELMAAVREAIEGALPAELRE